MGSLISPFYEFCCFRYEPLHVAVKMYIIKYSFFTFIHHHQYDQFDGRLGVSAVQCFNTVERLNLKCSVRPTNFYRDEKFSVGFGI